jgi:hypothetical protein
MTLEPGRLWRDLRATPVTDRPAHALVLAALAGYWLLAVLVDGALRIYERRKA